MRRYRSESGKTAEVENVDGSFGFFFGGYAVCAVSDGTVERFANCAEAFEWLVRSYGEGWTRDRR
jgi:hypothetical protein